MRALSVKDGKWTRSDVQDAAAARELEQADQLTWIRCDKVPVEGLQALGEAFGLHPLAIQELGEDDARPALKDFRDMTFCVIPVPDYKADRKELDWEEVGVFLGPDFVLTVSTETIQPFDALEERLAGGRLAGEDETLSHLFYEVVDTIVDSWFPFIQALEDELDQLETGVLESAEKEELERIRSIKRLVSHTRKVTLPMRDVVISLERDDHPNIDDVTTVYLRHTSDRMKRVVERLDYVKEMALISQDTWNAALANEQNTVMKRLTVLAGLLLIPSLFAGIGGMNFDDFPSTVSFWWFNGGILAFIVIGFWYSWRRGML